MAAAPGAATGTVRFVRQPTIGKAEARQLAHRGVMTLLAGEYGRLADWIIFHPGPVMRLEAEWPSAAAAVVKNPAGRGFLFAMAGHVFGDAPGVVECETLDDAEHHFYTAQACVKAAQVMRALESGTDR